MKKIPLFCTLSFVFCIGAAFASTSVDLENANYLADQGIITKQTVTSKYRLDDTITRAEVVGMALKIKGVELPNSYTCKNYFSDVRYNAKNNWICRAMEIGADEGIISKSNTGGRPGESVTRAEALAMVLKAARNNSLSIAPKGYTFSTDTVEWQRNIFYAAEDLISIIGTSYDYSGPSVFVNYFPNRNAKRGEVFDFAKHLITKDKCKTCGGFGDVFGASFGSNLTKDESTSTKLYFFGEKYENNAEGLIQWIHPYLITVEKAKSIKKLILEDTHELQSVGDWKGNKYYSFFGTGICGFNYIKFLGTQYTITVTAKCGTDVNGILNKLDEINFNPTLDPNNKEMIVMPTEIFEIYYFLLDTKYILGAHRMRSPAGVTLETFQSWYKNTSSVTFREETLKDLGNNTYEFLVDMTEGSVKSTYKVKSKVDVENFTIDNISSVKQ